MASIRDYFNGRSPIFTSPSSRRKALIYGIGGTTALIVIIVVIVSVTTGGPSESSVGRDALRKSPLIDGHNDLAMNIRTILKNNLTDFNFKDLSTSEKWNCSSCRTDLKKMRAGMMGAQFWSAFVDCLHKDPVQETLEQIDVIHRLVYKYQSDLELVTTADGIMRAFEGGKIGSLIGVEGGHSIDSRLGVLRTFYKLGVRYMTLTHTCNTPWADSCTSEDNPSNQSLTDFGKNIIAEMNRLGMMVDLSHVSKGVMNAVLDISKAPVIFSHSSARALCNNSRNVDDDVLKKLKSNGGIIMVNFYPGFLCSGSNSTIIGIPRIVAHINHIVDVIGIDHVGIGADFDGTDEDPKNMEDVSKYPLLFDLLHTQNLKRWSIENLEKLAGKNLIRVFSKVEEIRDDLSNHEPEQRWIPQEDLSEKDQICRTETDVENFVPTTTVVPTTVESTTVSVTTAETTTESTTISIATIVKENITDVTSSN